MSKLRDSLYNMRHLDDLAKKETPIHNLHPVTKLITTVVYLIVVVSFESNEIGRLLPFVFYPVILFALADLPLGPIMKRVLLAAPFVLGIGILNPVLDHRDVWFMGMTISRGWVTFLSIILKALLTITSSILLVATTGMDRIAMGLRVLRVPKIFVLQLLLTYRYISVLMEELFRMQRAYFLRAPMDKGIQKSAWGSFAGQLLLRTFDRAERVYQSMKLRGFTGEYYIGNIPRLSLKDIGYIIGWSLFFIVARYYDIPLLFGRLFI